MTCSSRKRKLLKILDVGFENHLRPVRFGLLAFLLRLEFSSFEFGAEKLAIPVAGNRKTRRKCVDRLGADPVQADTELKDVIVVFRAGVNLGNAIDHFAQWNSAAVIPDPDESPSMVTSILRP